MNVQTNVSGINRSITCCEEVSTEIIR